MPPAMAPEVNPLLTESARFCPVARPAPVPIIAASAAALTAVFVMYCPVYFPTKSETILPGAEA